MSNIVPFPTPIKGKDLSLAIGEASIKNIKQAIAQRAKMLGRVRSYEFRGIENKLDRSNFIPPIYDLSEISRVQDIEPFIAQSVRKHREQILKEGYSIKGPDQEMVDYIYQRLFEIALVTGISTERLIRELTTNVIAFHNGFIIIRRDSERSTGTKIKYFGKELEPIAGLFVGDPTTMEVKVDKYGTVRKWNQKLVNDSGTVQERQFDACDVIHIPIDKKSGYTFGTPYILPVLDDVRALRKLEELAITVISKEAFPLMHYKVGSEERPVMTFEGGGSEIDEVLAQVASLPAHGYIVTSERHEINLISKSGAIIDMSPYIQHFESRVLAGLRLSPLDLGRGGTANRGTATTINQNLESSAKDYQRAISETITQELIIPLLLEGGFDVTPENLCRFTFEIINKEEERAHQNHGLQLFLGNVITATEFRNNYLNKPPMSDEDKADRNLDHTTEAQIKILKSKPVSATASSTADLQSGVKAQVGNRAKPANQHGSKPKARVTSNDSLSEYKDKTNQLLNNLKAELLAGSNIEPDTVQTFVDEKLFSFVNSMVELSNESIIDTINKGLETAQKDFETDNPETDYLKQEIGRRSLERFFFNFVNKSVWKSINDYKTALYNSYQKDVEGNTFQVKIVPIIEKMRQDLVKLIDIQVITSERFGYIKFAKRMGYTNLDLIDTNTGDSNTIDISDVIYKKFIPSDPKDLAVLRFPKKENND